MRAVLAIVCLAAVPWCAGQAAEWAGWLLAAGELLAAGVWLAAMDIRAHEHG